MSSLSRRSTARRSRKRLSTDSSFHRIEVQALGRTLTYKRFDLLLDFRLESFFEAHFLAPSSLDGASAFSNSWSPHSSSTQAPWYRDMVGSPVPGDARTFGIYAAVGGDAAGLDAIDPFTDTITERAVTAFGGDRLNAAEVAPGVYRLFALDKTSGILTSYDPVAGAGAGQIPAPLGADIDATPDGKTLALLALLTSDGLLMLYDAEPLLLVRTIQVASPTSTPTRLVRVHEQMDRLSRLMALPATAPTSAAATSTGTRARTSPRPGRHLRPPGPLLHLRPGDRRLLHGAQHHGIRDRELRSHDRRGGYRERRDRRLRRPLRRTRRRPGPRPRGKR